MKKGAELIVEKKCIECHGVKGVVMEMPSI